MKIAVLAVLLLIISLASCSVSHTTSAIIENYSSSELETQDEVLTSSCSLMSGETYSKNNINTSTQYFSNTRVVLPVLPTDDLNNALKNDISQFLVGLDYPFEPECIDFYIEDIHFTRTFVFYVSDNSKLFNEANFKFFYNTLTNDFVTLEDFLDKRTIVSIFGKNHSVKIVGIQEDGISVFNGEEEVFVSSEQFSKEKFISVFHPDAYCPVTDDDNKFVALTFDDGPNPYTTNYLLDILDEKGIKATFFMVGINVDEYRTTVKNVFSRGHDIGIHSYKHSNYLTMDGESVMDDIEKCSELLHSLIGKYPYLVRPPYGNIDVDKIENDSYFLVNWNVDPLDWDTDSSEDVAKNILSNVSSGSIILLHDIYKSTCDAVEIVVEKLLDEGYRFVTISEFYDLNGKKTDNKLHFFHGDYNG